MPTEKKQKRTSQPFSVAQISAAKKAAGAVPSKRTKINWSKGVVSSGGGVNATVEEIRRTRGPNKQPVKEQVAIRLDPEVLEAFRADGPGWQTRMNAALKEWLAERSDNPRSRSKRAL